MMTDNGWRETTPNTPTRRDGDANGCVMAWHIYQGCIVTGAKNARDSSFITHWQKLPLGPDGQDGVEQEAAKAGALRRWNPRTGKLEAITDEE